MNAEQMLSLLECYLRHNHKNERHLQIVPFQLCPTIKFHYHVAVNMFYVLFVHKDRENELIYEDITKINRIQAAINDGRIDAMEVEKWLMSNM